MNDLETTIDGGDQFQELDEVREAIALVQVLELNDHSNAYDQIHGKLEQALRSIDGK